MRDFFTVGSPIKPEKVKPILTGWSFKYFYKHEQNQLFSAYFLNEKARKDLKDNP